MDWFTRKLLSKCLGNRIPRTLLICFSVVFYCEVVHYVVVLLLCTWPSIPEPSQVRASGHNLKVMILADTHLLGYREGHWFDRLRREWQMKQTFQTSMIIHKPDVVFVLGDLLDEGKWCDDAEFDYHVSRFKSMFSVPAGTQLHVVSGNHDEGFHYMMTADKHQRFEQAFDSPSIRMLDVKGNRFVLVNSMAMEGDGCSICQEAESQLNAISAQLLHHRKCEKNELKSETCKDLEKMQYIPPILLQHFPMYRKNDAECDTDDSMPEHEKNIPFRPKMDCLDQRSSKLLFSQLEPRLVISAHTHHGCYRLHPNKVAEWTVPSFSWRNKKNPTFLMGHINHHHVALSRCFMPDEGTVINLYTIGCVIAAFSLFFPSFILKRRQKIC